MPDSRAGEAYQLDIEALLREKYRLKIEASTRESILQWELVDGELPAGLTVRTNGNVAGIPERPRATPYLFRVRIVDRAASAADALIVSLRVVVAPPRLRLTRIEGPTLVPLDKSTTSAQAKESQPADNSRTAEFSPPPPRAPETKINNRHDLPVVSEPIKPPSAERGVFKKMAGVIGLDNDPDKPKSEGCADGSKSRRVESDEAHNPLEGDTSTQSTCVEFKNLNTLKYRVEFNTKTTRSEGPDLGSLPFLPKVSLTTTTPASEPSSNEPSRSLLDAAAAGVTTDEAKAKAREDARTDFKAKVDILNEEFAEARQMLNGAEIHLRRNVEMKINDFTTAIEKAHARSKNLANDADIYLQAGNAAKLITETKTLSGEIKTAVDNQWPAGAILEVMSTLDDVTVKLEDLRSLVSEDVWKEWLAANQDRYNRVRDRVIELKTKVSSLNPKSFEDAKNVLVRWQGVLKNINALGEKAFQQEVFVSCHTDEGESKASKLTIIKTDRTAENPSAVSREVLTVNCYSRVAVTAGFNFSTLDEKEFSVVESAGGENGATVKKFGFTHRSSFRPNPLALLNIRFTNNPEYNFHASFGAVVDMKGQTGTDVEPVAGISFSIRRLIFITPFALHFGRVNKLAGGFNEGDVVPESIATPPIEKAWKVGYTTGITFRIAPQ